jgi:adenine deaminase
MLALDQAPDITDALRAPKAELHIHLEGTIEPDMLFALAQRNSVVLPYESAADATRAYRFSDLQSFLDIYWKGLRVLCTEQDFYDVTRAYLNRAHDDNVVHAEIQITPADHCERGIPFEAIVDGVHSAIADARAALPISGGIILGMRRHRPVEEAFATLRTAKRHRNMILTIGLGGPEVGNPPSRLADVFRMAREFGWHTVGHAGEEGPAGYIGEAIDVLGVERVDHGVQ